MVIDERSDDYIVGEKSNTISSAFNANAVNDLAYTANNTAQIHAMC